MKRTISKFSLNAVLASLICLSSAFPANAADFFPLDLWEEMAGWQQNRAVVQGTQSEAGPEAMPMNRGEAGIVHTTFPFDVVEELHAIGESRWHDGREHAVSTGGIHGDKTNPYWLPAEFSTDIASGLTMVARK